ncbi:LacI family DNA-binding transcriptional regulator [Microbacterium sp. JZ31]|uniref:LacI family DNA-binding transcriptional regulator n=1 Tax=Microbacterium sp. JZ31 TaxID=1906274 RepID=UPI001933CBD2|nr:LacI family DNA-binding transcriptional regulator [Microbacterium sp. JZ31]
MVTMRDVAARAGVSVATVSFVVNGSKPVRADTRERVEEAMRSLGFRRNPVGAALARRGHTRIVALLYPALERPLTPTAVAFFTSASRRARERGYDLVMWPIGNDAEQVDVLARTGLVDGVLLMEVQLDDPRVDALRAADVPFALIGRTADPDGLAFVDIDFPASVLEALDRLRTLGHSRIAFVAGSEPGYHHAARTRAEVAYQDAMRAHGVEPTVIHISEEPIAGRALGAAFAVDHPDTTAVVLLNEHAAAGFLIGLAGAGTAVPHDLSVISMGTSAYMAGMGEPRLTYMRAPGPELGEWGLDALLERILSPDEAPQQRLLACEFVPGDTVERVLTNR